MTLWQEILIDYGDSCYFMTFEELADEYGTTPQAAGRAIQAIRRRGAMCGTVEYADGREISLSMKKAQQAKRKKVHKRNCGCQG